MDFNSRTANRLKHAAHLWSRYVESSAPRQLDRWLSECLRAEKRFGSQDRRFYSDVIFALARFVTAHAFDQFVKNGWPGFIQASVDQRRALLQSFCEKVNTENMLWESIQKLPPEYLVEKTFSLMKTQSYFHTEASILLEEIRQKDSLDEDDLRLLLVIHGIPPAWAASLQRRVAVSRWSQQELFRFLRAQNDRPPLWIRLNRDSAKADVERDLSSHELLVEWLDEQDCAKVSGSFGVYQTESFKSGLFEVQDWASQQIARSVLARPGDKIWDACAGGGGKTVALAASLVGKGALYATDIREHKLAEVRRRCQRAGFHNVRTMVWDGERLPPFGKEIAIQNGFDAVLVDAPCSSSGTWRRNPDARLRISDSRSRCALTALQLKLLTAASRQVRPGGRLIYGTCSWCCEENEEVVEAFLKGQSFSSDAMKLYGAPESDSDTMFAARLVLDSSEPGKS